MSGQLDFWMWTENSSDLKAGSSFCKGSGEFGLDSKCNHTYFEVLFADLIFFPQNPKIPFARV